MKRNTLSPRGEGAIRAELERERERFAEHDARRDRYSRALQRLADACYGICEGCGDAIAPGRLLAIPETPHCVTCSSRGVPALPVRQLATFNGG